MPRDHYHHHHQHARRSRDTGGDTKQQWGSHYANNHHSQQHHQVRYPPPGAQTAMPAPHHPYEDYGDGWAASGAAGGSRYPPVDRSREQWDPRRGYHPEEQRGWDANVTPSTVVPHERGHYERSWDREDHVQRGGWEPPTEQRTLKRGTWNREPASWDRPADFHPNEANRPWDAPRHPSQGAAQQHYFYNGDNHQHQLHGQNRKRKRKNQGSGNYKQPNHYAEDARGSFTNDSNPRHAQSTGHRYVTDLCLILYESR